MYMYTCIAMYMYYVRTVDLGYLLAQFHAWTHSKGNIWMSNIDIPSNNEML